MAGKLGRALVLLVLLAAALITQAPLAVFLLAFALVLLVLLRLDAAYLRRQVTAELLVPDKPVIQGEDFTLTVRLRNRSRLPIPALVVLLNAADEWGGGQITLRCAAMLGGKESAEQRITLNAGKSGVWSIAVRGITLRDHLGVFTAACPAAVQSQSICVLPAAAAGKAKAETAPDEDGDEADTRAALGGSYELREYRDGDTIKQVHWKLSAKLDELLIREPLVADRGELRLLMDLFGSRDTLESVFGKLTYIGGELLRRMLPFSVYFCDREGTPQGVRIDSHEALEAFMAAAFAQGFPENGKSIRDSGGNALYRGADWAYFLTPAGEQVAPE
mgnify:CR=1 FL=1